MQRLVIIIALCSGQYLFGGSPVYPLLDDNGTNYFFIGVGVGTELTDKYTGEVATVTRVNATTYSLSNDNFYEKNNIGQRWKVTNYVEYSIPSNVALGAWVRINSPDHELYGQDGVIIKISNNNILWIDVNGDGLVDGKVTNNLPQKYFLVIDPTNVPQFGFNNQHVGRYVEILANNPNYNRTKGDILRIIGIFDDGTALLASVSDGHTIHWNYRNSLWRFITYNPESQPSVPQEIFQTQTFNHTWKEGLGIGARIRAGSVEINGKYYDKVDLFDTQDQQNFLYFRLGINFRVHYDVFDNVPYNGDAYSYQKLFKYRIEVLNVTLYDVTYIPNAYQPRFFQYELEPNWWMWLKSMHLQVRFTLRKDFASELANFIGFEELDLNTWSNSHTIFSHRESEFTDFAENDIRWNVNQNFQFETSSHPISYPHETGDSYLKISEQEHGHTRLRLFGHTSLYKVEIFANRTFQSTGITQDQQYAGRAINTPFSEGTEYSRQDVFEMRTQTIHYANDMQLWGGSFY